MKTSFRCKIAAAATVLFLALASTLMASTAQITTSKSHYSVGEGMIVNGTGFSPQVTITLTVVRPDHLTDIVPGVTTDLAGSFTANYAPPSIPGRYNFTATDGANNATTATTGADAIGFNKAVYEKAVLDPADQTGHWTSGNAGDQYIENQWAFYQYQITGIGASNPPDFDVLFNHYQTNTKALFVDAFANFRACTGPPSVSNPQGYCLNSTLPATDGLLANTVPHPPTTFPLPIGTAWPDARSAILVINGRLDATGHCVNTVDPPNTTLSEDHCFKVSGAALKALFTSAFPNNLQIDWTTGTHAITLYYEAHLAASFVWGQGKEAYIGCAAGANSIYFAAPGGWVYPQNTVYGTGAYNPNADPCDATGAWTNVFSGIGFASGSSRHFNLDNQTDGSNGGLTLPIPSVAAPTGSITITKVTSPANSGSAFFGFTSTGNGLGNFNLDTNGNDATYPSTKTFTGLTGGLTYTVEETGLPTGWSFGTLTCPTNSGSNGVTIVGAKVTINLTTATNASVSCTYSNTGAGHIIVDKVTLPSGDSQSFAFTTTGTGYNGFSLTDAANPDNQVVGPGTYTVAETALTGWDLTSSTCDSGTPASITIVAGQTVHCTFTNTKRGTIVIRKTTTGDVGTFGFTSTGSLPSPAVAGAFSITTSVAGTAVAATFSNVVPGSFTVTESGPPAGWMFDSLSCTTGGSNAGQVATITLAAGATVTCDYVNKKSGTIVIRKNSVGAIGTFNFTSTGGLPSPAVAGAFSITTSVAGTFTSATFSNVTPGTSYAVTESGPSSGWIFTSLTCGAGGTVVSQTATIVVPAGGSVTCDYTNTKLGSIKIVKNAVGGDATFLFTSNFGVSSIATSGGTGNQTISNLLAGTGYSISEGALTGWVAGTFSCDHGTAAAIEVLPGTMTTCTITNKTVPTLTIVKYVHGDDGNGNLFKFDVTGDPLITSQIAFNVPMNGSYTYPPNGSPKVYLTVGSSDTINETLPALGGWTLTDFTCSGYSGGGTGAGPNDPVTGIPTNWNFVPALGDNVICTFVNSNVGTTRTQGFWSTHTVLANSVWTGTDPGSQAVIGSVDDNLCGVTITASAESGENVLMGGFWANISQKSTKGGKRLAIDQARMQMVQQYLAAVLNVHKFGSGTETMLSTARTAYCANSTSDIKAQIGILGAFNESGDSGIFTPGASASPKVSKAQADIDAWDTPIHPVD